MTMPRKHSRRIIVDEIPFRWCIGKGRLFQTGLGSGDRVIVESVDGHGATLVIVLPWDFCDDPTVTPGKVADWTRRALDHGWQPHQPGSPFELDLSSAR